jgi:predicted DNA-binding transcriptional regulator YafY
MRADRLLRLILVLSDGRPRQAQSLADELEVSLRTLFRDLDALREAGIPVTTTRGRTGGVSLPRGWTRYASGLSAEEVVPLAALAPAQPQLQAALTKIVAALPSMLQARAEDARQRLLIDPSPWWSWRDPPEALDRLREAVWADRPVQLQYRDGQGKLSDRRVSPLALVLKADRWHLVAQTEQGPRVFRADRILQATVLSERASRPADFDLPSFWKAHCQGFVQQRPEYRVRLQLTERGREMLAERRPSLEREEILGAEHPVLDFQKEDIALGQIVALGPEGKVLSPKSLQERLQELARHWLG